MDKIIFNKLRLIQNELILSELQLKEPTMMDELNRYKQLLRKYEEITYNRRGKKGQRRKLMSKCIKCSISSLVSLIVFDIVQRYKLKYSNNLVLYPVILRRMKELCKWYFRIIKMLHNNNKIYSNNISLILYLSNIYENSPYTVYFNFIFNI